MPEDIALRIRVLNPQKQPLGGKVDIELKPHAGGPPVVLRGADASRDIDVPGLLRGERGVYQATITGSSISAPVTQIVQAPATGTGIVEFVVQPAADRPAPTPGEPTGTTTGQFSTSGTLTFDSGLPAAGVTVRIYDIGFAGSDTKVGEAKSDAGGAYSITFIHQGDAPSLQLRVVDAAGNEVTISATVFNAPEKLTLDLVVPQSVQPLSSEFQRLAADMEKTIGGIAKLAQAKETDAQQDLTLLNQKTNWDARIAAVAATAAQQAATVGLNQDVLYALYRTGLPSDPQQLAMVPSSAITDALNKANDSGILTLNKDQIASAAKSFDAFSTKTRLGMVAPGAVSSFKDLLSTTLPDATQQAAFASLFFNNSDGDFWTQAAKLNIAPAALDSLKLQGKLLGLTFNNGPLAQKLQQDIGGLQNTALLAARDYHSADTWKNTLKQLAGAAGDAALQKLIPPIYTGDTTDDRLSAYAGDLARKVRMSFPTQTTARMIDRKELPLTDKVAANVSEFLNAAAPLGYKLGRTPLNRLLKDPRNAALKMDDDSTAALKTLHRLHQVTPSPESLQTTLKLGFTSAHDIAKFTPGEFIGKYENQFPAGEGRLVYWQSRLVSSITFNFLTMAKNMDSQPLVYALSPSSDTRETAKNSIGESFPTISSLFGNVDYCQCTECRSVLSPAAYFVDLLDFLATYPSTPANPTTYQDANNKTRELTPLDILLGNKSANISGRRPDLGALSLNCENTSTALPYIDIVNEILEYYIANQKLDSGVAYDTGSTSSADLVAEPQHLLPSVYSTTLRQAVYPRQLPFDLWIETVRGFLDFFKLSLAQVLDTMRPDDDLELFTDGNGRAYYRAQILAERLDLSPAEYQVLTATDPATGKTSVDNWFQLYGYGSQSVALNGEPDPNDNSKFKTPPLRSAKNLAERLGLTYLELREVVTTGFINPGIYPLLLEFERFGISLPDAFSYTNQPGRTPLSADQKTKFEALLDGITASFKTVNPASKFDARAWLTGLLPANYATKVLDLNDPANGCDFSKTTLQFADGTAATPLEYLKLNLFVRLWKKSGWSMDETDRALQAFFPKDPLPAWGDANLAGAFRDAMKTALVYMGHLEELNTRLQPDHGRVALLPLWGDIPVNGPQHDDSDGQPDPLYAQLFLGPGVLNADWAFDDPNGKFPTPPGDFAPASAGQQPGSTFAAHQSAVQGVLGLSVQDISAIFADAGSAVDTISAVINGKNVQAPAFTLANLSLCYRYGLLAQSTGLAIKDLIALRAMSGLDPFQKPTGSKITDLAGDVLYKQTLQFLKHVDAVQNSGFTVEDLRYLLRHDFDPIGTYQNDPNALLSLAQSLTAGLQQIQNQNTVPADLTSTSETVIDQSLSKVLPASVLKALFAVIGNSQTFTAAQAANAPLDSAPFAADARLSFSYDATTKTQTIGYRGLLTDSRKSELKQLDASATFAALLDAIQAQARTVLGQRIADLLGVWASLAQYQSAKKGIAAISPADALLKADSALTLAYDQAAQLQWLAYRGVLTDVKKAALVAINNSADLKQLLDDVQSQASGAYRNVAGTILAAWTNAQSYTATKNGPPSDTAAFLADLAAAQQAGTIASLPALQFTYDDGTQTQTLVCAGILTTGAAAQLKALPSCDATISTLLQSLHNEAMQQFQSLATDLLTVAAGDLDSLAAPLIGLDASKQQKHVKAALLSVFLPLNSDKLSHQLIVQTVASGIGADPAVVEPLATDAALLTDNTNPGKPLLSAFAAIGQRGVTGAFFASADGSGAAQAKGTAATVDTADPSSGGNTAGSAHFEGYLQVPTDGPYRFFAELGNVGSSALLQLDSPDPTPLLTNPIIPATKAAKANDELSQFVQLKGGVMYHFTVDFASLGTDGARLLIQGEGLPKGPLGQIVLYSSEAIDGFTRAYTLLAKVTQILKTLSLDLRELIYITANAAQFNGVKLSSLPTRRSDDSQANAQSLFKQFLALADYADLRKGPAGATDALIDVLQAASAPGTASQAITSITRANGVVTATLAASLSVPGGNGGGMIAVNGVGDATFNGNFVLASGSGSQTLTWTQAGGNAVSAGGTVACTPVTVLASLIRRTPDAVQDVASALGPQPHFTTPAGIRRVWEALQMVQLVDIPASALSAATAIASLSPPASSPAPNAIAANFRNAVRAQYTAESWRPVAQSIFDPLRRQKRDALVAYLVNALALENGNQLFEYFLVDPGMEPVVQTSRLRLALSSVQTFVQRCLLNLESGNTNRKLVITPDAINADQWQWRKRYRVWEASRKIFLYPENWMEPELRLDKTDLFQTLEGSLLQGDVSSDLVEDAFLTYLKGLEARARLDIVAMYLEQNIQAPGLSVLHVLGRTYGHPHKYFYRTYTGTWSAWIPVTQDIDGDHIVLAKWKDRVNIFWVTFVPQAKAPDTSGVPSSNQPVSNLTLDTLATNLSDITPQAQIQAQLHWVDYFEGKWSTRTSSNPSPPQAITLDGPFAANSVGVHVSIDKNSDGTDAAALVHLDIPNIAPGDDLFVSAGPGKFGSRVSAAAHRRLVPPAGFSFRVTSKNCAPEFSSAYHQAAPVDNYSAKTVDASRYDGSGSLFATFDVSIPSSGTSTSHNENILQSTGDFELLLCGNSVAASAFVPQDDPERDQAGALVAPFFYKDSGKIADELTFFVQPSLTEKTIDEWERWAIGSAAQAVDWSQMVKTIPVVAQVPAATTPAGPPNPYAIHSFQDRTDWLTHESTLLSYNNSLIGKVGRTDLTMLRAGAVRSAVTGVGIGRLNRIANTRVLKAFAAGAGVNVVGSEGITITK